MLLLNHPHKRKMRHSRRIVPNMILNQRKLIFEMSPRSEFSDKIDVLLYKGNFSIFVKILGIVGGVKFQ